MSDKNLWPQINFEGGRTPRSILADQANSLSDMTKNVLVGRVYRRDMPNKPNRLYYGFEMIAPALGNYTYNILYMEYNLIGNYPVGIIWGDQVLEANSESEFLTVLKDIFKDESTINIIRSLYTQSVDE